MWDWKRPSYNESVTAQGSRSQAPKMYRVLINTLIPLLLTYVVNKVAERPVLMKSSILLFGGNWSEDAGMSNINECIIIHTERERFLRASSTASS